MTERRRNQTEGKQDIAQHGIKLASLVASHGEVINEMGSSAKREEEEEEENPLCIEDWENCAWGQHKQSFA